MSEPPPLPLAGWRVSLARALEASPPSTPLGGRWATLATVRAPGNDERLAGRPSARTVNLRGLDATTVRDAGTTDAALLRFINDARAAKAEDLRHDPRAEIALLLHPAMLQLRFSGEVHAVGGPPRDAHPLGDVDDWWGKLQPFERKYFSWPPPGAPREHPLGSQMDRSAFPEHGPDARPDCFLMCALVPDHVEALDLGVFPPVRTMYWKDPQNPKLWKPEEVNP